MARAGRPSGCSSFYGNEKGVWGLEAEMGYLGSRVRVSSVSGPIVFIRKRIAVLSAWPQSPPPTDPPASASQIAKNQFCNNVIA